MRHRFTQFNRLKDTDRRKVILGGIACLAVLALALYGFLGKSANQKVKTGGGKPLVKVALRLAQAMFDHAPQSAQP